MSGQAAEPSKAQRALWTFLLFTLVAPFIAAILAAGYTPLAIWANMAPYTAGDHAAYDVSNLPDAGGLIEVCIQSALRTFVWAPIAAAVAGLGMAAVLLSRGEVGWAIAGAIGVVGFFVANIIAPFGAGELLPAFALVAGLVASALSLVLLRIGVLPPITES